MKYLSLVFLLMLSACSINKVEGTKSLPIGKVDFCLNKTDSDDYLSSMFNKPLEEHVNLIEPSGASVIISMAISGRVSKNISAEDIAPLVLKKTNGEPMVSFLNIKHVVSELGYKATGYNAKIIPEMKGSKRIMAITTDVGGGLLILAGVKDEIMYMVYPDKRVCLLDYNTFYNEFYPNAIMLINK